MSKSQSKTDRLGALFESVTDESSVTTEGDINNDREVDADEEFDGHVEDGLDDAIKGADSGGGSSDPN